MEHQENIKLKGHNVESTHPKGIKFSKRQEKESRRSKA